MEISRRQLICSLGGGLGVLGLAARPHFAPRARRVIQLVMNGGPHAADFFDPKPEVKKFAGKRPEEVRLRTERKTAGLLPSPFSFRPCGKSGVPVTDLLPLFGRRIDDVCVLRSVHTDNPNHGPALLLINNGTISPRRPSMGAWLSYGLGVENESLPSYVVLCPGRPVRFSILWNSAFLPAEHQGVYVNHSKLDPGRMIPYLRGKGGADRREVDLIGRLNREHLASRGADAALEARIRSMETAFRMQAEAGDAFDLSREPDSVRKEYGGGHFAHGCLLARRLSERGVRFVQVYYGNGQPWDTHKDHDKQVRKLAATIDRPMAALLADLKRRGLLEETLVVWGGEFGRTPVSENGNGRDHNPYGFTMWLAGGGVRGGTTYGETDPFGFRAVEKPMHVHDLHATILHLMGIDHKRLTYRHAGRDFRLTDEFGRVATGVLA